MCCKDDKKDEKKGSCNCEGECACEKDGKEISNDNCKCASGEEREPEEGDSCCKD